MPVPALLIFALLTLALLAGDDPKAASTQKIDFDAQIKPIFQARCLNCHAKGKYKGGFSLENREATLKGGESGPGFIVGKSESSLLVELVAGLDPDRRMPASGDPLSKAEVELIRAWIDQGASWPESSGLGFRKAPLAPRRPAVPEVCDLENPVDRFACRHQTERGIKSHWASVPDRVFARRASLDLVGILPTPEQISNFEKDTRADRHLKFAENLLNDRHAYADHWLTFWNDALRNSYRGTGFIDGGRATITRWLYQSLYENQPYDRFVHDLISPVPGSEGFTKGIVWRGVVNASQVPPVQAAQNISQVFLGTNLKCASCHDSFVNHWKLADAYALASVFAEKPLEIHRCDQGTGKTSGVGFIYPELGTIDASKPRLDRMKQLADLLVKPEDGRFARTIVNRLWASMMGRGIVEPLDDMDQLAWDQDLLDWLASDFVANGYDLKHTLALIAGSKAYRLPSKGLADPTDRTTYAFKGPLTKRMTAEQFADALATVTGVWPELADDMVRVDGRGQGGQVAAARASIVAEAKASNRPTTEVDAKWIWNKPDAEHDEGGRILVRKTIQLDKRPTSALAVATADNEAVLFVNGKKVGQTTDWAKPIVVDITRYLKVGDNVITAEATNWPDRKHNKGTNVNGANPAAFIAWVGGFDKTHQLWGIGTDATWLWSEEAKGPWKHSFELPNAARIYGGSVNLTELVTRSAPIGNSSTVRASLAFDDPLMAALGRTSREQVVTHRDPIATTLQALELTNGGTLDARLQLGAKRWIDREGKDPKTLARKLFQTALGREPNPEEMSTAKDLIGSPATAEGLHDLLWALMMLPEFQLID
jgi:mono/diheme cytochrome c family protein